MHKTQRMKQIFLNSYSPFCMLVIWEILSRRDIIPSQFFPAPSAIFYDMAVLFREGTLWTDCLATLRRILGGLLAGGIPGLVLGIAMARSRIFYYFLYPLIMATYPIPKISIIPFIILFLGLGDLAKICVIGIGSFFLVCLNTYHGVRSIPKVYFDVSHIYRLTFWERWRYVILPGALPSICNGVKLANGLCFMLVVAAEFMGSRNGLGYRIWLSWESFRITHMFSALFTLAFLAALLSVGWEMISRFLMPWDASK